MSPPFRSIEEGLRVTPSKPAAAVSAAPPRVLPGRGPCRSVLFFAFAFTVIADPVSSVAYAIEAPLRALHGDLCCCRR
ncbi:hypothetical protein [Streptomyces sp. TP-A0356]|uniref:hypothetical protein n=1 Tax=Streptomyces sp. TP-A0356 TaxID=1359208 RepID=UPI001F1967A2|nr:hypothetical protein [Streptomyces sp. TP-A0356]